MKNVLAELVKTLGKRGLKEKRDKGLFSETKQKAGYAWFQGLGLGLA